MTTLLDFLITFLLGGALLAAGIHGLVRLALFFRRKTR